MNRRLTERSLLHICNTFLKILTASNNAAFCITPTLHMTIWQFFVALARAPIVTGTITTILSFCNLPISLQFLVLFHFFFFFGTALWMIIAFRSLLTIIVMSSLLDSITLSQWTFISHITFTSSFSTYRYRMFSYDFSECSNPFFL